MPIATRLTNTGTLLVNGSFDENTSIAPTKFRTTSTTVYAPELDEVTINGGATAKREIDTGVLQVKNIFDEFTGAPVVDSSLQLWLDAAQTASYPGSGTTWTDLSGNGNNGTLVNAPTFSSIVGGGTLIFNGINQYATITGYKGITGTAARTSIVWFKTNVLNTPYRLLGWGTASLGAKWNISLDVTTYRVRAELAGGAAVTCNPGTPNVADTNWHMVATTAPAGGTANDIKIYIDGNLITDVTITNGATAINTVANIDVSFGASLVDASPNYLNGNISTGQIYNRALTADEITTNFNALRNRYGI
jgi:hypothetical protein